jgi:ribose transport system substrate-binding protein
MDKSDAVIQLIKDGALICTMAQNPDVMGYEGMYAAITAINDGKVAPEYIDTGVSILNLDAVK